MFLTSRSMVFHLRRPKRSLQMISPISYRIPTICMEKKGLFFLAWVPGFACLSCAIAREDRMWFASFPYVRQISTNSNSMRVLSMRDRYDFSNSIQNPYAKRMKKQITIRLDEETISYFKDMADEKGISYQSLINLYLRDCAATRRELKLKWM